MAAVGHTHSQHFQRIREEYGRHSCG
jgi:hypothetical protein